MNKERLITYMYGEMNQAEEEHFRNELIQNPELQAELEAMQEVSNILSKDIDDAPTKPIVIERIKTKTQFPRWNKWMSMAASLAFIMVLGKVLGLQVEAKEGTLSIHYGNEKTIIEAPKNVVSEKKNDVNYQLLAHGIEKLQEAINQQIELSSVQNTETEQAFRKLKNSISKRETKWEENFAIATTDMIDDLRIENDFANTKMARELLEYININRKEDLQFINEGFNNLALLIRTNSGEASPQLVYQKVQN